MGFFYPQSKNLKVIESFQVDKAPGEDGFTAEFFKYFFELLGNDLTASFNEAQVKGELSISQRRRKQRQLITIPAY